MSDGDDRTEMIEAHLPLVRQITISMATRFPRHVEREELVRAGVLGLVEAARRYDPERGVPFAKFASRRIRGAVLDAVRAADWAPRSVRVGIRAVEQAEQTLAARLGRSPTRAERAAAVELSPAELSELEGRAQRASVLALDHHVADDAGETLALVDVLSDVDARLPVEELEHRELHGYVRDALSQLPDRHRQVVVGYFLEGRTSLELGELLEVTESRISQLRSEALLMMREGISAQYEDGPAAENPTGRVARRKARYAAAITQSSGWRGRLESNPPISA